MTAYDLERLAKEVAQLPETASSTTTKGRRLQDLAEYVFCEIPTCQFVSRNEWNESGSQEVDLWLRHNPALSNLPFSDFIFPVECKNETRPVTSGEVTLFAQKIQQSGGRDGVLVCSSGVAGSPGANAHQQISVALNTGILIHVLTVAQISALTTAEELAELLQEVHLRLRLKQAHRS